MKREVVVIIPVYKPDEKFIAHLADLRENGFDRIVVVDDGSGTEFKQYFDVAERDYGCHVLRHAINLGQGRAYKTAFNYYLSELNGLYSGTIGVVQCDCDGQHHIDDIIKCEGLLKENPDSFILGVRDFSDKTIPFRSRFGNSCTSFVFRFFCGLNLKDTQTGLKGIPRSFVPCLMESHGERFEYASSVLLETKTRGVSIIQFPIRTIYIEGNATSHFNPLLDSIRIYSLILKYLMSSLSSFIVDIVVFSISMTLIRGMLPESYIVVSTYVAKVFSCTYGYFINKKYVFKSNGRPVVTAIKFFSLCIVQSTCSGLLTTGLVMSTTWNEVLCKIIVDTLLFFLSFQVQNHWVFRNTQGA